MKNLGGTKTGVAVSRVAGGTTVVWTYGSTGCPPVVSSARLVAPNHVVVVFANDSHRNCLSDLIVWTTPIRFATDDHHALTVKVDLPAFPAHNVTLGPL